MIIFNPETALVVEVIVLLDKDPKAGVSRAPMELGAKLGFKPRSACPQSQFTFHPWYQKWVIMKFSWGKVWHSRDSTA